MVFVIFPSLGFRTPALMTHCKAGVSLTFEEKKFPTQLSLKHCKWL